MRFLTWLQSLRGRSTGDSSPSSSTYQRPGPSSTFSSNPASTGRRKSRIGPDDADAFPKARAGRERTRSMSRPRSIYKSRRSWFGGQADADEGIPAVPKLIQSGQTRDIPLAELSSNHSANDDHAAMAKRRSARYMQIQKGPLSALPALPAMPVTVDKSAAQPGTSPLPADKRRSRHLSVQNTQRRSSVSSIKSRRQSSFWMSSNPDDSDSDVPPVPPLVRGDSAESSRHDDSEDNSDRSRRLTRTHNDASQKPRPTSVVSTMSRRSYTPRSAAKGFLKSTNGASEESRQSFRKSFNMDDGADMVCLTEEQRIEWAKLMNSDVKLADATRAPSTEPNKTTNVDGKRTSYSNSQALAALEFGIRR